MSASSAPSSASAASNGHAAAAADAGAGPRRSSTTHLNADDEAALERKLANRPTKEVLEKQNILKGDGPFAAQQAALAKHLAHDSVSRSLDHRPDAHELEARHVLQASSLAPRLQSTAIQLEHAITRDQISHLLDSRPDAEELIHHNIMQPMPIASRIQGVQRTLQHNFTKDRVTHLLQRRQDVESLQHQNILDENTMRVAPSLQATQRSLQRNLAKANLYHALKRRPDRAVLEKKGIIHPDEASGADGFDQKFDAAPPQPTAYQRRSKNFHLTRILLRSVANMAEMGEISLKQKGFLKDLIVDQDPTILQIAENFDASTDYAEFQDALIRLAQTEE